MAWPGGLPVGRRLAQKGRSLLHWIGHMRGTELANEVAVSGKEWHLEVARGPNAGARIALRPGDYRFGCATANDIVLADSAVADRQGVFRVAPDGTVLDVTAPGVRVGRRPADPGTAISLAGGMEIAVGETLLRVHGPPAMRWTLLPMALAGPVLLVAALSVAFAAHQPVNRNAMVAASVPLLPAAARVPDITPQGVAHDLTRRMQQFGLNEHVHVDTSLGAIIVSGQVNRDDMVRWRDLEQWFDAHHANIALISHVTADAGPSLPQIGIRAVWAGTIPYVITTTGDRYTEGAVIDGDWTITRITSDGLELTRNGRVVHITL